MRLDIPNTIEQVEALGGYQILSGDPNWSYDRNTGRGVADNHYDTSLADEIAALPVSRIAAKDAILFLWVTWPILLEDNPKKALDDVRKVCRAWGFRLKTIGFVWVKTNQKAGTPFWGGGSWTRSNTEICIIAVRGDIRRIDSKAGRSVSQIIETWEDSVPDNVLRAPHPRLNGKKHHSAKPPEVRNRIIQLVGDLPAIELYARCVDSEGKVIPGGRVAENWDQWGLECDSDVIIPLTNTPRAA